MSIETSFRTQFEYPLEYDNIPVELVPDPKDAARNAYAARRPDLQDHATGRKLKPSPILQGRESDDSHTKEIKQGYLEYLEEQDAVTMDETADDWDWLNTEDMRVFAQDHIDFDPYDLIDDIDDYDPFLYPGHSYDDYVDDYAYDMSTFEIDYASDVAAEDPRLYVHKYDDYFMNALENHVGISTSVEIPEANPAATATELRPDPKDSARVRYAKRRRDRQDHATGKKHKSYNDFDFAPGQKLADRLLRQDILDGYVQYTEDQVEAVAEEVAENIPMHRTDIVAFDSDDQSGTEKFSVNPSEPETQAWFCAGPSEVLVDSANLADELLTDLNAGKITKAEAFKYFMKSAVFSSDIEDEMLNHFRTSSRLAPASTLEGGPVQDLDYIDGYSIKKIF